jgi:CheY-like chemotaxis protein
VIESALRYKYDLRSLNDPAQALQVAREFQPHLILLDLSMPGMTGIELAHQFSQFPELSDIPIMFLTAQVSTPDVADNRVYLPKLLELDELEYSIDGMLTRIGSERR